MIINIDKENVNILVVDDVSFNIEIIGNILKNNGYRFEFATNGKKAIEYAILKRFDLILLDVMMPGMDGYEVCSILKSKRSTRDIPIIFLTAKTETEDIVKGFKVGGIDYVKKPFNEVELLARIETHLKLKKSNDIITEQNKKLQEINAEKVEENKKLLEEVIEYDKLKTEFFSNVSHELRTPLNIIFSTIQLMALYADNDSINHNVEKFNKYINIMKQNSYRLLRLVNNLIDITKIDSGFIQLNMQNKNIVEVIENITLSTVEYVQSKCRQITFDTDVEEKNMAFDPESMERIILNLISNAVKFTKPNDKIDVEICDKNEILSISVKDTGVGIPEDKQKVIFDRFRQADNLYNRSCEGSGIGLSLVKALVEMHSGTISVNSKCGEGTEFIIELPVKFVPEEKNIPKEDFSEEFNVEKIQIEFSDIYGD